ncbi:MAG: peptide deformylase [Alphaproteobacteria bacterium]|nr:peptide deformylase [Alphaproteobacteria bacterium SS10]
MAILPILRMGHPTLRRLAEPLELPAKPEIRRLAADMIETMVAAPGVGLAAPQIGQSVRMIVYQLPAARLEAQPDGDEPTPPMPPTVLINPVLRPLSEAQHYRAEGCLSIPGIRGEVPRYRHLSYHGYDLDGQPISGEAHDFHARVLQHEVDHLDGVLYLDRMVDMMSIGFLDAMIEPAADADPIETVEKD